MRLPARRPALVVQMLLCAAGLSFLGGCSATAPADLLLLTQVPPGEHRLSNPGTVLDSRYPAGSRVVLAASPFNPAKVRVLSEGLVAAGDAVFGPGRDRVLFVGKQKLKSPWQIYEVEVKGGAPRALTTVEGGAMSPTLIAGGDLIFSSPVPRDIIPGPGQRLPALYRQMGRNAPRRLTWGTRAALDATVLADGRILFVSAKVSTPGSNSIPNVALFTINNDGTEYSRFAIDQDGAPLVRRPRELSDGRVAFLAGDQCNDFRPEAVRKGRPFASRNAVWEMKLGSCTSIEPGPEQSLLICAAGAVSGHTAAPSESVYLIPNGAVTLGAPFFHDPRWSTIEAAMLTTASAPMGHISTIEPGEKTGTILCLDANYTRGKPAGSSAVRAVRVRVLTETAAGGTRKLGEIEIQPDGSFMAELPADTPLGFESVDAQGQVLQRLAPSLWVRPGENRSCIGCHEPYNRSPRNHRPLAVTAPPVTVTGEVGSDKIALQP